MADEMKSVLRRKLEGKSTTASGIKNMSGLWAEIKKETLRAVGEALGRDLTSGVHTMGKISMQKFKSNYNMRTTMYHLGSTMEVLSCLIYFTPQLASRLTEKKLGAKSEGEEALEPGLLDLFLIQPLVNQLADGLKTSFEKSYSADKCPAFGLRDQMLSLDELKGVPEDFDLYQYTLNLSETDDEDLTIGFCFHYGSLEKLSIEGDDRVSISDFDVNDPWVGHMQTAVLQARLPMWVVLDDLKMSVGECSRFKVGQVIPLSGASLSDLKVRTRTKAGMVEVARSELGILKQQKAVKLNEDFDEQFVQDLPNLVTG